MLSVYKYESQSFPRQKHSLPPFDWRAGWRRANKKRNPQTHLPSPDKGEPRENIYAVLHACVYLRYICTFLSKQGWKKGTHDRESYWTQENAHANSVNSKSSSQVYRFRPGTESLSLSVEFSPKAPQCPPQAAQAAAPTSLYLCLPLGHWSPFQQRKKCQAPRGQLRRAPARPSTPARRGTWGEQGAARPFPSTPPRRPVLRRRRNLYTCEAC